MLRVNITRQSAVLREKIVFILVAAQFRRRPYFVKLDPKLGRSALHACCLGMVVELTARFIQV